MIKSKTDYKAYLEADRVSLGVDKGLRAYLFDDIWKFQRQLRRLEYLHNCNKNWFLRKWATYRYANLGTRLGFSIPINTFGPGLSIAHRGTIVVNSKARIGANCRLHVCVNIGEGTEPGSTPVIGDNCYIAPGVKLFGRIVVGPNTALGANAVINKSFPQGNVTLGGIPAKVISNKGSQGLVTRGYPQAAAERQAGPEVQLPRETPRYG